MAVPTKKLTTEITSNYTYFEQFLAYLPDPADVILDDPEGAYEVFQKMMLDPHINAKIQQLKDEVLSKEFHVVPADESAKAKEIADFVKQAIYENLNIEQDFAELLSAIEYGFSVSEVIWKQENGYWLPDSLRARKPEKFRFNTKGELLYYDPVEGWKKLDTTYKFIIHRHNPQVENPYGTSVLLSCYWPWMFKKAGWKFWLKVAEKFGVPTVLALLKGEGLPESQIEEAANYVAEALLNIQEDAAVALVGVDRVETLDSKGSAEDFARLIELCNAEISKAITGEILTADKGNTGSYALAKVHSETLKRRGRKVAKALANTLNRSLIRWMVELNYGKDQLHEAPKLQFDLTEIPEWEQVKDAIDRGVPVSKEALYSNYNLPKPVSEEDVFISPKLAAQGGMNFSDFFTLPRRVSLKP
ncbi:phage portal protein family protein [Desulfurobacterium sp.]